MRRLGISQTLRVLVSGIVTASVLSFAGAWWSTGASASAKNSAPIKVFITANVNDPAIQEPSSPAGAEAATADINRRGGINGHKLDLTFCDVAAQSTLAENCAREAVSDHVVATVGSHESFSALTFPIYKAAGIPMIGLYPSSPTPDLTSSISYPFFAGTSASLEASVLAMKEQGITKIGIAAIQSTAGTSAEAQLEPFISRVGSKFVGSVGLSPSATDFTPYVEQLHSEGAQGVLMVTSSAEDASLFSAAASLGVSGITWAGLPNLTEQDLANTSGSTKLIVLSPYPPFRSAKQYPGIAQWLADLKANHAPNGVQYEAPEGLNAWLAVMAFAQIVKTIHGPITTQSVTAALHRQTKGIDLYGLVNWQPDKSGPSLAPRVANGNFYEVVFRHGQLQLESSKPFNVYQAAGT
jgi:ABC-type branched-subunit amino acid transport system substrate-binding protein